MKVSQNNHNLPLLGLRLAGPRAMTPSLDISGAGCAAGVGHTGGDSGHVQWELGILVQMEVESLPLTQQQVVVSSKAVGGVKV